MKDTTQQKIRKWIHRNIFCFEKVPMDFSAALKELKEGRCLTRLSWKQRVRIRFYNAHICKYIEGSKSEATIWQPTQEELLAEDWIIFL